MRCALLLALAILTLLSGCVNPSQRRIVWDHKPGGSTTATEVKYDATFALHTVEDSEANRPLTTVTLKAGSKIGFQSEGEVVFAIAGDEKIPVSFGRGYVWRVTPETEMSPWLNLSNKARDNCKSVAQDTWAVLTLPVWLPLLLICPWMAEL